MVTAVAEDWQQVGDALRRRIDELHLTKAEVTRLSGVSDKTLDRYLAGHPLKRRDKARELSVALQWTPDAIEKILRGEQPEPVRLDTEPLEDRVERLEAELSRLREVLERQVVRRPRSGR